jgi:hypothetical protein
MGGHARHAQDCSAGGRRCNDGAFPRRPAADDGRVRGRSAHPRRTLRARGRSHGPRAPRLADARGRPHAAAPGSHPRTGQRPRARRSIAHLHAAQLGRRSVSVSHSHRGAHRSGHLSRAHAGDAAERNPLHEHGRRHSCQSRSRQRTARAGEHVRRRRVREGRSRHRDGISRPDAVVLPDGRHGDGRDGARRRRFALRKAACVGFRTERRLPAGAGAPREHDDRRPVRRVGAPDRGRLHRRSGSRKPRCAERQMGFQRAHRRSAPQAPRPRQRADRRPGAAVRSRQRIPTAFSTTRSTRPRCGRSPNSSRTTGATSMARCTPSINAPAT